MTRLMPVEAFDSRGLLPRRFCIVVDDVLRKDTPGAIFRRLRAEGARFDDGRGDAERRHLVRQRLRPPLQRLGFGYYPRSGFMHIDLGPARSWGDPFPARAVPFAPELPPAREVLSDSRTLRGGGAAGAATVGAAGVEVLQDVLAETQTTIQPLVPYLDTLRWVLIAIALIGIAVTIHARLDDWKRGQR